MISKMSIACIYLVLFKIVYFLGGCDEYFKYISKGSYCILHTYAKMFVAEIMLSKKSFKIIG